MILTVVRISLLRMYHNRAELLLTFVVPLIFFSIFAWIFGSRESDGGTPRIKIAVVDLVQTEVSTQIVDNLHEVRSLRFLGEQPSGQAVTASGDETTADKPLLRSEKTAEDWVRRGLVTTAILLKPTEKPMETTSTSLNIKAEILADSYDQVAPQIISSIVQKSLAAASQSVIQSAAEQRQRAALQTADYSVAANPNSNLAMDSASLASANFPIQTSELMPSVEIRDVLGANKVNPVVAMYAAGIAVMFSLFSATTASGSLLEERENMTLERLLCSQLSIDQLLMGKWLYLTCLGITQITLMFVWGWLVFGVDLISHLGGFAIMTLVTSAAAASFALMLATLCKSRIQLGWVSTIVILVMSALGGSMVPRYLMSESVQHVGMFTFNAWALEGYSKVFWRELSIRDLNLELAVLLTSSFVMLIAARLFAVRWERT